MKRLILLIGIMMSVLSYGFYMIPAGFDKRIDNGEGYMEYRFPNPGNKTIRYKFEALPGSAHRKDMSKWTEIYPKILTIKPEQTGVLKVFVEAPKGAAEGEYGFFLDAMPIEVIERGKAEEGQVAAGSAVKIRAAIELVGYVGDLKANVELVNKKIYEKDGKKYMDITLKNRTSKRGLTLEARVKGSNNKIKSQLLGRLVANGEITTTIPLEELKGARPAEIEFVEEIGQNTVKKYVL